MVSEFHQQSVNAVEMGVHWVGAFRTWYRYLSAIVGVGIFVSYVTLVTVPPVAAVIGAGALERVAMWGGLCWQMHHRHHAHSRVNEK